MNNFIIVLLILLLSVLSFSAELYKGSEYRTIDTFTYGRFEVCFKASSGPGQTSTFFTYHELGDEGSSAWNEIDFEVLGRYTNDVQVNPITPGQSSHEYHCWVDVDPSKDYHIYTFEWTPEHVVWFFDGQEIHRQTGEHIEQLNRDQKIMMNIWPPVYEDWVGKLIPEALPVFAFYDYVSYSSHTPGSGDNGTDNNFTLQWKDELDSWDQDRWEKATHTFPGNLCDFYPDNVVFQDGKMILCLTDSDNTGFTDRTPPFVQWARYESGNILLYFSEEVDKVTAEKTNNYMLRNGGTIKSITLESDNRTVTCNVEGYDTEVAHDILAINVKDLSSTPNSCGPKFVNIFHPAELSFPLKINVGGVAANGFFSDQDWSFEANYGHMSGSFGNSTDQISNTDLDSVYQEELYDFVCYKVRVPNGIYNVELMLSENHFSENDKRVMTINVEGNFVATGLDVHKEAGKNNAYNILEENIEVTDGIIDLHFAASKNETSLHGLIIDQISTSIKEYSNEVSSNYKLKQNYPNPFNASTTIEYYIYEEADVSLTVYDILGDKVTTLIDRRHKSGSHIIKWNPEVSSGVYFYYLEINDVLIDKRKMILMK